MLRLFVASCLLLAVLPTTGCVPGLLTAGPASVSNAPVQLLVRPPAGDGLVSLNLTVKLAGASQFRFFLRTGTRDDELTVAARGEHEFVWDAKGLAAGVYTLWVSAYGGGGRFLGASPLTDLVLTPSNASALPPLRGIVRDAS